MVKKIVVSLVLFSVGLQASERDWDNSPYKHLWNGIKFEQANSPHSTSSSSSSDNLAVRYQRGYWPAPLSDIPPRSRNDFLKKSNPEESKKGVEPDLPTYSETQQMNELNK